MKPATSFPQKVILIGFGVLLSLFLIEISLRLGGLILSSLQRYRNQLSLQQKGTYRILCLGESTTANQYPRFLEQALNRRSRGVKFSVIDKGILGIATSHILGSLEFNLNEYRPDMVITMMGINDWGPHLPYETLAGSKTMRFFKSLRVYKLARLLGLHMVTKFKELKSDQQRTIAEFIKNDKVYAGLAWLYQNQSKPSKDEASFNKYAQLGWRSLNQGEFPQSEALLKKAIEIDPRNDLAYIRLAWLYLSHDKFVEAEAVFDKIIALNPKSDYAYAGIVWLYMCRDQLLEAERILNKAIALNPKDDLAYTGLLWFYLGQGKFVEAREAFNKAVALNPQNDKAYSGLVWLYLSQGKFVEAERAFNKVVELNPRNDSACAQLLWLYLGKIKPSEVGSSDKASVPGSPDEKAFTKLVKLFQGKNNPSKFLPSSTIVLSLDPNDDRAYAELGFRYLGLGQSNFSEAQALFNQAIEFNPKNELAYAGLGWIYLRLGKFVEAKASFTKVLALDPKNDKAYAALSELYRQMGNIELAREYKEKAEKLRLNYYLPDTIKNYHKLKAILDKRNIRYVCMQYPLRSIQSLKKMFQADAAGIIFVDNQRIFEDALQEGKFEDYFLDRFGGDFGHCTPKGNRLIAENIANVIVKEVFGKEALYQ